MTGDSLPFALDASIPDPSRSSALVNIQCTIRDGIGRVDYTYQTGRLINSGPTFTQELDATVQEESILRHPDIRNLLDTYANGCVGGMPKWLPMYNGYINPMGNVQTFYSPSAVYSVRSASTDCSIINISKVGYIATATSSQGSLPSCGSRSWLNAGYEIEQTGDQYLITEKFLLSGPSGWNTDIYS